MRTWCVSCVVVMAASPAAADPGTPAGTAPGGAPGVAPAPEPTCGRPLYFEPAILAGYLTRNHRTYVEGRVALGLESAHCEPRATHLHVGAVVSMNLAAEGGFQIGGELEVERPMGRFERVGLRAGVVTGGGTQLISFGPRFRVPAVNLGLDLLVSTQGPYTEDPVPGIPPHTYLTGGRPSYGAAVHLGFHGKGGAAIAGAVVGVGLALATAFAITDSS